MAGEKSTYSIGTWSMAAILAVLGFTALVGGGYLAGSIRQMGASPTTPQSDVDVLVSATSIYQTPFAIQGKFGQEANLLELQDSTGTPVFSVGPDGTLTPTPEGGGGPGGVTWHFYSYEAEGAEPGVLTYELRRAVWELKAVEEHTVAVDQADGDKLINTWNNATDELGILRLVIPGGYWQFDMWAEVDSAAGTTKLLAKVYAYDTVGETETLLCEADLGEVNATSPTLYTKSIQVASKILPENSILRFKLYANTTSVTDINVTVSVGGTAEPLYDCMIKTPINEQDEMSTNGNLGPIGAVPATVGAGRLGATSMRYDSDTGGFYLGSPQQETEALFKLAQGGATTWPLYLEGCTGQDVGFIVCKDDEGNVKFSVNKNGVITPAPVAGDIYGTPTQNVIQKGSATAKTLADSNIKDSGSQITMPTDPVLAVSNTDVVVQASGTGKCPLVLQGQSGQTANLFEIRNSSGTIKFSVAADGTVTNLATSNQFLEAMATLNVR